MRNGACYLASAARAERDRLKTITFFEHDGGRNDPISMSHLIAPDYGQQFLFPPALEDWVAADHPARFLREFVEQLDLPALQFVMPAATEGRPPYAPSLLLKIWLYGYYHRIRATRRLEAACKEVLPLVWLAGLITPDHNSLWRFWRDNKKALREVFKQSVQLAVRTGAVGLALQALDGTKVQAAASCASGWNQEQMEKLLAALDAAIEDTELKIVAENADLAAAPLVVNLPAGLAQRQALREQIQKGLAQLAADGRAHYHPMEPEARRMKVRGQNTFAYNAQAVADEKAGVIVACEVTRHENDQGQLAPMTQQAQENLSVAGRPSVTVADQGYGAGADVAAAVEQDLNVLVSPAEGTPARDNPYAAQHFTYDAPTHTVTCPRGQKLDPEGRTTKKAMVAERFRCHCRDCPVRAECTRDPKGRQIEVWPHTPAVQAMRQRLKDQWARRQLQQRREIIERRFGQIKQHDGFRRWTVWGLEHVRTQWALLCTALNLRVLYGRWRAGRGGTGPPRSGAAGPALVLSWIERVRILGKKLDRGWRRLRGRGETWCLTGRAASRVPSC